MAKYRVMSWRGIPSQVKATDETGATVSKMMPTFFQQEIDRVAMAEGLAGTEEYLEGWDWSGHTDRDGTAEDVAEAVIAELEEDWRRAHA